MFYTMVEQGNIMSSMTVEQGNIILSERLNKGI